MSGTVNPTTKWLASAAWTSVLAAMPGVVLLLMHIFEFDARAEWYKRRQQSWTSLRKPCFRGEEHQRCIALLTITSEELESSRGRRVWEPPC